MSKRPTMLTKTFGDAFETLTETDRLVVMSISVLVERIRSLPKADRDDLFELVQEVAKTDDPEEWQSCRRAMEEILTQAPITVRPFPGADAERPLSDQARKWAEHVGRTIRSLREKAGLTQAALAEKAGLRQSHISRLESAEHTPTRKTLEKLADALHVDVRTLDPCDD